MIALPLAARTILPAAAICLALATSAYAQGTDEQREACTPDALKLCSNTIPDIPKTTACMKAHQAALSPRCRAVFDEPATKAPAVAAASKAAEASKTRHAKRAALAREERDAPVELRRREATTRPYADPLGGARADDVGDVDRQGPDGGPPEAYGPDIRHFPPGDGPDEVGPPLPYGEGRYDARPRGWDGPRFADRDGPDGYDGPGPGRRGPPEFDGPPGRDDFEPGPARRNGRSARIVIARMCARGEIDRRTCSETIHALERRQD